jgi:hypothetical protein
VDVLVGVDAVPWATLDHCFGASDDIPDLLREAAAGSEEALEELGSYMVHQGTLYEATPYLVRFLARIAACGAATVEITVGILDLLGFVAGSDTEGQERDVRGRTRASLAGEITMLVPLLAASSSEVRDAAAWALPQSLAADRLVPALRARWDREPSPQVAASVLRGLSFLDPGGTVALAADALTSEDSAVRLVAAWAFVTAGVPWSGELREGALAWMADGALTEGFRWGSWSEHPFSDLAGELAERGSPAAAAELVSGALTRPAAPGTREVALLAASHLADISRSAAAGLIAPLISVVASDDPEASESAIVQFRELGALAQAADELALVADAEGPGRRADWALACLLQIGDPRCVPLLARDYRHRPFALDTLRHPVPPAAWPPFSAALLDEVRRCLRDQPLGEEAAASLIGLTGSWGPAAAAAVPDLLAVLPRCGYAVGRALGDIAGATPEAVSLLRQAAAGKAGLHAAARLHALTGEEQLLLAAIEAGLSQTGYRLRDAAEAARTLTPASRLIPALAAALDSAASKASPDNRTCTELALALWHHSGAPDPAVEVIGANLRAEATRSYRGTAGAAQAAAVLGPAAGPLVPAILPLLDSPGACTAAVRALLRIDPENHGGIPLAALAERLLLPLDRTWGYVQMSAVQVLGEMGLSQLPAHVVARLRELATQDRRIIHGGSVQARIHDDDQLRTAILALISDTGQPTSSV